MLIKEIEYRDTIEFIMTKHYAQRIPSISFSFGLFIEGNLEGILTIGKPASNALCEGVCGKEYKESVFELNRLVVNEGMPKNTLSQFVSQVLRMLKEKDIIIVSYSDLGMGHNGYIYQATNFIYTGKTSGRTDKYMPGGKHSRHYTEEFAYLRKVRTEKNRYIYFTGKSRKKYIKLLKYPMLPYPKGDNNRYILGERQKQVILNTIDGTTFTE